MERELSSWDTESPPQNKSGAPREALIGSIKSGLSALAHALEQDQRSIKRMVDEHLEAMKKASMLPVASLMESFPKMVRDLAREQGKEVDLVICGDEIEIDKRVLEDMKDSLIHLVRNCVDHGIRKPDERTAQKKAPRGTITISFATLDSRRVEIVVFDDGDGIDKEKVRAAAIKSGAAEPEAAKRMSPGEVLSLIFRSGITTSPMITDISGRGLGLAIVREKVEKLGGTVSVDSEARKGTTFRVILPLTLATFRGVPVRPGDQKYILPTTGVERAIRVNRETIQTVGNRETIQVDGRAVPLVRLREVLDSTSGRGMASPENSEIFPAIVLAYADERIAFQVDEILDERQFMVKNLGKQLKRVRNVSGATILGSGALALVLNVSDLMKSAVRAASAPRSTADAKEASAEKKSVLVAEDSITARSLLKGILESAGYRVTTAVDGADAYAKARAEIFDLVVSDVDMPRMSGFELTAKIRGDKNLARLPVVLVTALESREDRERGVDSGADAYIVKSSFDQSNLLDVIKRVA